MVRVRRVLATGTMNLILEEDKGINTCLKTRKRIHSCILCTVTTNVNFNLFVSNNLLSDVFGCAALQVVIVIREIYFLEKVAPANGHKKKE